MTTKKKDGSDRTRNWTFLVYPDSAPADWIEKLTEQQIPFIVSPLHDKDATPTGELKKAHWHVVLVFSSVKSYEQAKEITESVLGTIPERVKDIRAMVRYLTHIDYPSKAQYVKNDIKLCGGVDIDLDAYFLTKSDLKQIRREMFDFLIQNEVTEICDLVDYAKQFRPEWYDQLVMSDYFLSQMITSRRHKKEQHSLILNRFNEQATDHKSHECGKAR